MGLTVRLYASHDADLIALSNAGFSVKNMLKDAFYAFANSQPFHILIDEDIPLTCDQAETNKQYKLYFSKKDLNVSRLLGKIVPRKKNLFCKTVLRNAFIQQNLRSLIIDSSLENLFLSNLSSKQIPSEGVVLLSSYKDSQTVEFAGRIFTKPIEEKHKIEIPNLSRPAARKTTVHKPASHNIVKVPTDVITGSIVDSLDKERDLYESNNNVLVAKTSEIVKSESSTTSNINTNSILNMMSRICQDND